MKYVIAALIIALSSGCATIMTGGTSQEIVVKTDPPGATVLIDGTDAGGITPCRAWVWRRTGHFVHITRKGYQPYDGELKLGLNGWVFGNFIFGFIPGFIIDMADGSWLGEYPDHLDVPLKPDYPALRR